MDVVFHRYPYTTSYVTRNVCDSICTLLSCESRAPGSGLCPLSPLHLVEMKLERSRMTCRYFGVPGPKRAVVGSFAVRVLLAHFLMTSGAHYVHP